MVTKARWAAFASEFRLGWAFGRAYAHAGMSSAPFRGPTHTSVYDRAFMRGYRKQEALEAKRGKRRLRK